MLWDNQGNRIAITDARGISANYRYDVLNRLVGVDYPGADDDISYQYGVN
jgi:YD repeat-containing protein